MPNTNDKSPNPAGDNAPVANPHEVADQSPTKAAAAWIWPKLMRTWPGRLLAFGVVLLAVLGWLEAQFEVVGKVPKFFKRPATYATPDEITCLNEWVLELAAVNKEDEAEQTRAKFLNDYRVFGHVNSLYQPIWENDVHVVRDLTRAGEWLVVIDMYPGASTRECMESGKAEMVAVLDAKPPAEQRDWDNRIGRVLRPAEPLCYDFSEFERTNGRVLNTGSDVQYQRSLGPCASKQRNPPGFFCVRGY